MASKSLKAVKLFCGGIHGLQEIAVRSDGAVFKRYQDKGPYGYRWGAWKSQGRVEVASLGHEYQGCYARDGQLHVRLPQPGC